MLNFTDTRAIVWIWKFTPYLWNILYSSIKRGSGYTVVISLREWEHNTIEIVSRAESSPLRTMHEILYHLGSLDIGISQWNCIPSPRNYKHFSWNTFPIWKFIVKIKSTFRVFLISILMLLTWMILCRWKFGDTLLNNTN